MENTIVAGRMEDGFESILTQDAIAFVADLHRRFNPQRQALLVRRQARQDQIDSGDSFAFLPETASVRSGDWTVRASPGDLTDRRCEITGPTDRKMVINALNCGARVFMADFEDSNSPTWHNMVHGQINLYDAIRRQINFTNEVGKAYVLNENPPEELRAAIEQAVRACPKQAITIEE